MSAPHDVLAQLLSAAQADSLDGVATNVWTAASAALGGVLGAIPGIEGVDGRLVMPEEVAGEYTAPHLVAPVEVSTDKDETAVAYLVFDTAAAAAALGSEADDPNDQEQQTMVMASTVLGQVVQSLNSEVFSQSNSGLVLSLDDMAANTMPALLAAMDDPALALDGRLMLAKPLALKLVLPGTFLDIVAGAMPGTAGVLGVAATGSDDAASSALMAEVSEVEEGMAPEPEFATAGAAASASGGGMRASMGAREPTPISQGPGAQRARFAPLAEPEASATRSTMDLLSGLQMNVTVELGRTELTVAAVLGLGPGSVVELDRLAGEPVDILVNERLIARGEVVVVDENFGVRVVEVVRHSDDEQSR